MGTSMSNDAANVGAELLTEENSDQASVDAVRQEPRREVNGDDRRSSNSEFPISRHLSKSLGEPIIEVRDIRKEFTIKGREEVITALSGVTLARDSAFGPIRRGEFVMIRGPSGGGKTTLLNMLGTLDYPTGGTIEIMSSVVNSESSDRYLANLRLRKIGFVFQTFNLISTMSAFENVELPMIIHGVDSHSKIYCIPLLFMCGQ